MLGNSEAMLAALSLWAFERHLDGRRDHALYLGFAAALLRPEAWPFLGLYGLWLWFRDPELRLRIAAIGVAVPVLWFGPELWGSGEPLRASSRANNPNPGSAAFADNPTLEVIKRFAQRTVIPLFLAAGRGHGARRARLAARPPRRRHAWRSPGSPSPGSALVAVMTERRLRGQPALPDRDHRGALRARRRGRRADLRRASGRCADRVTGSAAARARGDGRRVPAGAWSRSRR